MFKMSSSTDPSTRAAQIVVELDGIDAGGGAIGKLVKKLSKSRRIVRKPKKPQRSKKIVKVTGSEKRLPKYLSSVNKKLELLLKL